jgi:hypothetical protein
LVLILLSAAMFVAPRRAWPQTPQARGSADWSGPRGPLPADVLECSQWATNATGFNPGSSPMAPSWTEPKPAANTARGRYNRWMGLCLGQRESRATQP